MQIIEYTSLHCYETKSLKNLQSQNNIRLLTMHVRSFCPGSRASDLNIEDFEIAQDTFVTYKDVLTQIKQNQISRRKMN